VPDIGDFFMLVFLSNKDMSSPEMIKIKTVLVEAELNRTFAPKRRRVESPLNFPRRHAALELKCNENHEKRFPHFR
ncbi:MAG: hypothetical protein II655_09720, partial [Thermoguttaceae bacterium]|nr:hypothetical protein [Thermoguttaceae bacterium]